MDFSHTEKVGTHAIPKPGATEEKKEEEEEDDDLNIDDI